MLAEKATDKFLPGHSANASLALRDLLEAHATQIATALSAAEKFASIPINDGDVPEHPILTRIPAGASDWTKNVSIFVSDVIRLRAAMRALDGGE